MIFQFKNMLLVVLLITSVMLKAQQATLSGTIFSESAQLPLENATITLNQSKGVFADSLGNFSFILKTNQTVHLSISFVGFEEQKYQFYFSKDTSIICYLQSSSLNEIVITDKVLHKKNNTITIPIEQIEVIPTLLGEKDPLKALILQAGISGGTEGTSTINVRGGSGDQNLVLYDGTRVYNNGHLLGFLSVFNPSIIQDIGIVKGGFAPKYGGRLSSILTVNSKNATKNKQSISLGLLSSHFFVERKPNDKWSYMYGGRLGNLAIYTLPITIANATGNSDQGIGYWMYDLNAKVKYKINPSSYFTFSSYHGNDYFNVVNQDSRHDIDKEKVETTWGNNIISLSYSYLKDKYSATYRVSHSNYHLNIGIQDFENDVVENEIRNLSAINDITISSNQNLIHNNSFLSNFGFEFILHRFSPSFVSLYNTDTLVSIPIHNEKFQAIEPAIFYNATLHFLDKITVDIGARGSLNKLQSDSIFLNIEPRIKFQFQPNPYLLFYTEYTKMVQPMHLLSNTGSGFPNEIWIPTSSSNPPQIAQQIDVGIQYSKNALNLGSAVFYKKMENLVDYSQGASALLSVVQRWNLLLENQGIGEAYGLELFATKQTDNYQIAFNYTLSKTIRQFQNLNFGNPYPYDFDRRHDLAITFFYKFNDKLSLSSNFVFASGRPYTAPSALILDEYNNPEPIYLEKNNDRLPNYHRLDIAVQRKKVTKKGKNAQWSYGIYNAYGNRNIFSLRTTNYRLDNHNEVERHIYQLEGFALFRFFPFITYQINFVI